VLQQADFWSCAAQCFGGERAGYKLQGTRLPASQPCPRVESSKSESEQRDLSLPQSPGQQRQPCPWRAHSSPRRQPFALPFLKTILSSSFLHLLFCPQFTPTPTKTPLRRSPPNLPSGPSTTTRRPLIRPTPYLRRQRHTTPTLITND
jgi:hypothetical protein